ncbi:MAG: ATP-binding protein [Acidimicrobiaceae bacterium]|nr:AAA family ATPase [Acidimicrobiia bacterium]MCY4493647.1 ATP-binding protein [Acidimicrobiaceae bacterium]
MILPPTSVDSLPDNPFTPDFGQQPSRLVGRDDLVATLKQGLGTGPRDPRFTSLLLGPRGSGKTVILNHLKNEARASGWIVLSLDATTEGIHERISERIDWGRSTHESVPDDDTDITSRRVASLRVPPIIWEREATRTPRPRWGLRRQLTTLAEHAAEHDTAALLVVDEMHSGDFTELRRLAADLQHITKDELMPLAFLGAGLSEMKRTLLEDKRMTFFARCNRGNMPPLSRINAHRFLTATVHEAGGAFNDAALDSLVASVGSLPYRMQLLGHSAWNAAGAPANTIDANAAALAVNETDRLMHERVALPAWHSLAESEQAYLAALAAFGGEATPRQVAQALSVNPRTLTRAWRHLENAEYISTDGHERVRIADVITVGSVKRIAAEAAMHTYNDPAAQQPSAIRCNAWMPRAHAKCVLSLGHAGRHRSR